MKTIGPVVSAILLAFFLSVASAQSTETMALGGIGTGYLEIGTNGMFQNFEPTSSFAEPYRAPALSLTLLTETNGFTKSMALLDSGNQPNHKILVAKATKRFPTMSLEYEKPISGPISAQVQVMSSFAPSNLDMSNLPAVLILVSLKNNSSARTTATLMFRSSQPDFVKSSAQSRVFSSGAITGRIIETADHFGFATGALAGASKPKFRPICKMEANQTTYQIAISIEPHSARTATIGLAWYAPWNKDSSGRRSINRYSLRFTDAGHVLRYALSKAGTIAKTVVAWHTAIDRRSIPNWLKLGLTGSFEIYPRQSHCDDLDTVTVSEVARSPIQKTTHLLYTGLATELFFPRLASNSVRTLTRLQSESGEIPGATEWSPSGLRPIFGAERATASAAFILLAHRQWKSTGDAAFLTAIYPNTKKAAKFTMELDPDQDGLINEIEDAATKRSGTDWHGTAANTACIGLAAIQAFKEMAQSVTDLESVSAADSRMTKGIEAYNSLLWAGTHYRTYSDPDQFRQDDRCFPNQLDGQWLAWVSGQRTFLPLDRVQTALATCLTHTNRGLPPADAAILAASGIYSRSDKVANAKWLDFVNASVQEGGSEPLPVLWAVLLALEGNTVRFQPVRVSH